MRRAVVALVIAVAALAAAVPARAQVEAQSSGTAIVEAPALGVAADGQAVLAWPGSVTIFASVRPAGVVFSARRRLTGGDSAARSYALGVGRRGDAVVVWQRSDHRGHATGPLHANVRRPSGAFGAAARVPGSDRGGAPAAAVAPDGTLLVAWLRGAARGCGAVVLASVARPGRPFGRARRVSSSCPHAAALHAAGGGLARGPRERRVRARGCAGGPDTLRNRPARQPRAGRGLRALAGSDAGALVVWRDRVSDGPTGAVGRVLSANVTVDGVGEILRVSEGARAVGVPRVTARPDGSALVAWEEEPAPPRVVTARRPAHTAAFEPPTLVDACGATDAGYSQDTAETANSPAAWRRAGL